MTGVDLGFVPVVRVPEPSASRVGARAYTHAGVVHLPESAGSLDSAANQALIAHELTHVMQQRALGSSASHEGPLGVALEAQASAVERSHLGEPVDPEQLAWPEGAGAPAAGLSWTIDSGFQTIPQLPGHSEASAPGSSSPQRAGNGPPPPPPPGPGPLQFYQEPADDSSVQPLRYPDVHIEDGQEVTESPSTSPQPRTLTDEEVARVAELVRAGLVLPKLDPLDPNLLDALSKGLYAPLRFALRSELIGDRERAGMLTEFQ